MCNYHYIRTHTYTYTYVPSVVVADVVVVVGVFVVDVVVVVVLFTVVLAIAVISKKGHVGKKMVMTKRVKQQANPKHQCFHDCIGISVYILTYISL